MTTTQAMLVKIVSFMTENHASPERYRSMADLGIFYEGEQMKKIFIVFFARKPDDL